MIGFFPEPYPDEFLFSVCARYAEVSGYKTARSALYDLFDSRRAAMAADLPARLRTLVSRLPPGHRVSIDRLISDHTLVPLFTPFVSARRVAILKERMAGTRGGLLHGSLGVNTFASKVKVFRYCPPCVEADRAAFGETYWHRSHHVPGVSLCAIHKTYLRETDVHLRYSRRRRPFVTAETTLPGADLVAVVERDNRLLKLQATLASNAKWLLEHPKFAGYQSNHRNRYVHLLYERDYCTYSGVLNRRKLAADFNSYFSLNFLQMMNCEIVPDGNENWLHRLVYTRDRVLHPIHHLLLLQFLDQNPESFFSTVSHGISKSQKPEPRSSPETIPLFVAAPFGDAPWPCLNPASDHFRQCVVTVCEVGCTQLHPRRPHGIFRCECGFAYSRIGPDQTEADRLRLHRYVSFGEQWDNTLREGVEKGETYAVISQRLRVSTETMRKELCRLGLKATQGRTLVLYPRKTYSRKTYSSKTRPPIKELVDRRRISRSVLERRRAVRRREFLQLRKANSNLSRSELHVAGKAVYGWLYRHDRKWLKQHLPERRARATKVANSVWAERDSALAAAVPVEADKIRALAGRPMRITETFIAQKLEVGSVWSKRAHLIPLTCQALRAVAETFDECAVRRVAWATSHFKSQGLSPAGWRVALHAGLSGETAKRPVIRAAIEQAVVFLKAHMELSSSDPDAA